MLSHLAVCSAGECALLPDELDWDLLELTASQAVAKLCTRELTAGALSGALQAAGRRLC